MFAAPAGAILGIMTGVLFGGSLGVITTGVTRDIIKAVRKYLKGPQKQQKETKQEEQKLDVREI
jgi:hypothetical protein